MKIAFLAAVVLAAFIVESAAGFGATVVTVTLGAQLLPLDAVLAAFLPVNGCCRSRWSRGMRAR